MLKQTYLKQVPGANGRRADELLKSSTKSLVAVLAELVRWGSVGTHTYITFLAQT